jgi:endoglucanase
MSNGKLVFSCIFGVVFAGCITSPASEYGATPIAKKEHLNSCPDGLIDDLEDNDSQIAKKEGREGYWFTFTDTYGSTITPRDKFNADTGGPDGSHYAAHMQGKISTTGQYPYVGMGFSFLNPKGNYDASKYKGISFWAKGNGKVRLEVLDANTQPEGDRCTACYNNFGVELYLSDQWTRYTVPFDRLAQQPGWGDQTGAVSTKELFGVQWQFRTAGSQYDIWFDDIEFVGCQ